jgi:energy-coupling factor transporter ATP-binding protein EcfA2
VKFSHLSRALLLAVSTVSISTGISYASTSAAFATEEIDRSPGLSIAHMQKVIADNLTKCQDDVRGKDITIVLGNTGSGKSTMLNLLARAEMKVDIDGNFVPIVPKLKVRAGGMSCTKFPELIFGTDLGDLCDLPGFQDSVDIDNLLNAAFIRSALINAKSVRALILTTEAELRSVHARAFRDLSKFIGLFQNKDFVKESCYLIINRVERAKIVREKAGTGDLLTAAYESIDTGDIGQRHLKELMDSRKIFFIPASRCPESTEESISERDKIVSVYTELVGTVRGIRGRPVPAFEINMAQSMNTDTQTIVKKFLQVLLSERHEEMKQDAYAAGKAILYDAANTGRVSKKASEEMKEHYADFWNMFDKAFKSSPEYTLLEPICGSLIHEELGKFEPEFQRTYNAQIRELIIIEEKEAKEAAERASEVAKIEAQEADAARLIAVAAEQNALENEEKARDAAKRAEADAERSRSAEEEATRVAEVEILKASEARLAAEAAKQDKNMSEAEKIKAQQAAIQAEKLALDAEREAARLYTENERNQILANQADEARRKAIEDAGNARKEMMEIQQKAEQKQAEFERKTAEAIAKSADLEKVYAKRMEDMQDQIKEREQAAARNIEAMQYQMTQIREDSAREREAAARDLREYQETQTRALVQLKEQQERERQTWKDDLQAQQKKMEDKLKEIKDNPPAPAAAPVQQYIPMYYPWFLYNGGY